MPVERDPRLIRFVLDVHLAKLARHLRMIGFDSAWGSETGDDELLSAAIAERRTLLTRDRALHDRAPEDLRHYVQATDPKEQLIEVLTRFGLWDFSSSKKGFLTRCLECNSLILPARGDQLEDRLPAHVRLEHREFFLCPRCERVYWKGSHFDRMMKWVDSLR